MHVDELVIAPGEKIALLGENGCGKTTLLQALTGLLPVQGTIHYGDQRWDCLNARQRAEHMSYLPQEADVLFNLTVAELMELSLSQGHLLPEKERHQVVRATEMEAFQTRVFHSLSGGEKRRAMLARVFCRASPFLFLDEPTAPLDMRHAALCMRYAAQSPQAVVAAMHDLNLAVRSFERFLLMKNGRILFDKHKADLQVFELEEIYGIRLNRCGDHFIPDPER